ncbi:MAG TPA: glycosyltransferase [Candidatus Cloacimonadota bacterium]|nr:glycosyltransferase [Candidatus Cloacimonadota bacterium]
MRILYLSYFFPPLGGPASLRSAKTIKYLVKQGWEVEVITIRDIEYTYFDESIGHDASSVLRTQSLDPMSLLKVLRKGSSGDTGTIYKRTPERFKRFIRRLYPIDDKIGWLPFLIKSGRKKLAEKHFDLIYVSCGPFSSALGAYKLSRETGVPFVYEARDYWTLLSDYPMQGVFRGYSRYWERKILESAALIVNVTQGIAEDSFTAFGMQLRDKSITVYNGWDEEDFQDLAPKPDTAYSFAYFGNIYARRSLRAFYQALDRIRREGLLPEGARVDLYGNFPREVEEEIGSSSVSDLVRIIPQLGHREALEKMMSSSVLLLLINSSSPRGTLTSKVFEYLRCGKPILAMVPYHNEASCLLRDCGHDHICAMESPDSIYLEVKRLITEKRGKQEYRTPWEYTRENQVTGLSDKLKSMFGQG